MISTILILAKKLAPHSVSESRSFVGSRAVTRATSWETTWYSVGLELAWADCLSNCWMQVFVLYETLTFACLSCTVWPPNTLLYTTALLAFVLFFAFAAQLWPNTATTCNCYFPRSACLPFAFSSVCALGATLSNHQLFYSADSFLRVCDEKGHNFTTVEATHCATAMVRCGPLHESDTIPDSAGHPRTYARDYILIARKLSNRMCVSYTDFGARAARARCEDSSAFLDS